MNPAAETLTNPRPFDDIPRAGRMRLARALLHPHGERVDMLTPLENQYESCGSVVRQPLGPFRMLNLFGPDACQMVLRYRWTVDDAYRMPVQQAPISRPMDGLPVQLERIQ